LTIAMALKFELVTLAGTKFSEEVFEVVLPTPQGYIGVFPSHIPLISIATPGVISIRRKEGDRDDQLELFATNGGVIEIADNQVRVLADDADNADEISEKEAQDAYSRAKDIYKNAKDQHELEKAKSNMDRQAVRLQVANLKRHKRR
jgi:F-type H+-transporting ATPase subunit epsilon